MTKNKYKIIFYILTFLMMSCSFANVHEKRDIAIQIDELKIDYSEKRIIALSLSAIEMLDIMGIKPVGISLTGSQSLPYYLASKMKNVEIVGSVANPSLERIQSLKPDLIIIDRIYEEQKEIVNKLNKISPVLNIRSKDYKSTLNVLKKIGQIFKKDKETTHFINKFNKSIYEVKQNSTNKKRTILAIYITNNKIWAWTDKSFLASLLQEINVDYAFKEKSNSPYKDLTELNFEKILEIDPDKILVFEDPGKDIIPFLEKNSMWKNLKSVKNKNISVVNRDIWSRSRGPLAAEVIVKTMENDTK